MQSEMRTVKTLFDEAIRYEMKSLVYCILYALKNKNIRLDDSEEKFFNTRFADTDNEQIARLIESNPLRLDIIKIYSLKMDKRKFAMIYARSREEAIQYYQELFHKKPLNCHEILLDHEILLGKKSVSFREMRKQFNTFPAYAGFIERGYR